MNSVLRRIGRQVLGLGLACAAAVGAGRGQEVGAQEAAPGPWRIFLPELRQTRPPLARTALAAVGACQVDRFEHREPLALIRDVDVDRRGRLYAVTSLGVVALLPDGSWAEWPETADSFSDEHNLRRVLRVAVDGQDRPWFGEELRFTFVPRFNAAPRAIVFGGLWFLDPASASDPAQWTRQALRGREQWAQGDAIGPVTALTADPAGGIWSAERQGWNGTGGMAGMSWPIDAAVLRPRPDGSFERIPAPCGAEDAACRSEGAQQLLVRPNGDLWLLQPGIGLRLRRADGSWPTVLGGQELAPLRAMAEDPSSGTLWLAGDSSGQLLQSRSRDRWRRHDLPRLPDGSVFPPPQTMAADHRGNLWLAAGGRAAVRWADGRWTLFVEDGPLGGGQVVRAWSDRRGDVWLDHDRPGASGGVLRIHCP